MGGGNGDFGGDGITVTKMERRLSMKHGWEYKKLGDFITEYSVKNKGNETIPVYSVTNSQGFCKEYFSKEVASQDKSTYKIVPYGCFAYNPSRINVGSIDWQDKEERVIVSPLYNVFSVSEKLNQDYLLYFIKSKGTMELINAQATGTVRLNLKLSMLKEFQIPIPSLHQQQSIVSELDKINELIRLKKEQLGDYEKLAQSLFYEMFGDPVENEKGWEVKKLGDITKIGTGSTPSRNNNDYYQGTIPWVKSTEVCNCVIDSTEEHISELALNETNCTIYPKNSILIAMYGQGKTRGQVAILNIEATTNQAVAAIQPCEICNKIYMFQYLRLMYETIRCMARGGNQANLNLSLVKSINIPLPPLSLQNLFAQRIELIEQQKAEIKSTIADLETLLASRMQYWFFGF